MRTQLTAHDSRLSKLENTVSTLRSSMRTVQATNSQKGVEQRRISSMVHQHGGLVRDLSQEALVSGRRAKTRTSSVENRIGELGERMNEVRVANTNSAIPPSVIQSLNNTIMDGAPSSTVECSGQRIEELTQVICTKRVISANLRMEFSEFQKKANSSILPQGAAIMRPNSQTPRSYPCDERSTESRTILEEVKAREG